METAKEAVTNKYADFPKGGKEKMSFDFPLFLQD